MFRYLEFRIDRLVQIVFCHLVAKSTLSNLIYFGLDFLVYKVLGALSIKYISNVTKRIIGGKYR